MKIVISWKKIFHNICISICFIGLLGCDVKKSNQPSSEYLFSMGYDPFDESPEAGGIGFNGKDWESPVDNAPTIGDPTSQKGGILKLGINNFPVTMRFLGKDSNYTINSTMRDLLYETLLKLHPNTLEYVPSLATHWQILRDYKTFRFRLNPNARWADGKPVTSQDIIASWKLHTDEGIESPNVTQAYKKFKKPVAESKYIFHVTATELNWTLFLTFIDMTIYPAHIIEKLDGKTYLTEYENQILLGSGPYELPIELLERGQKIVFLRRHNYWGINEKFNLGVYNFDRIELLVEPDPKKSYERFKSGEFDIYPVNEAERWVKETKFSEIDRGLIQKRQIYNKSPQGISGIALNMRNPPLDNPAVRQALAMLFNRELMIKQFFYDQYTPIDSYFPGSVYANPKNPLYRFTPDKAIELLTKAGYKKNKEGWLVKDGKILELRFHCPAALIKRGIMKVFQDDLKKAGILLHLIETNPKDHSSIVRKYKFEMVSMSWSGSLFPDPEGMWSSLFADKEDANNICGMKSEKIDKICEAYNKMFLQSQRAKTLQELDGILMDKNPYILGWATNCHRILYWNRFHFPAGQFTKTGRYLDVLSLWSLDAQKTQRIQEAQTDTTIALPVGNLEQKYWIEQN